jgi:hypothetical protein
MLTAFIIVLVVTAGIVLVLTVATIRQYICAPLVRHGDREAEEKHPQ